MAQSDVLYVFERRRSSKRRVVCGNLYRTPPPLDGPEIGWDNVRWHFRRESGFVRNAAAAASEIKRHQCSHGD